MPPKKKKGGKKKKKSKGWTPAEIAKFANDCVNGLHEKTIEDLGQQNDQCNEIYEGLKERLTNAEDMRNLMTTYLKQKVSALTSKNRKMAEEQEELVETLKRNQEKVQQKRESLKLEYKAKIDAKDQACRDVKRKYLALSKFEADEPTLQEKIRGLTAMLKTEREGHQIKLADMTRKHKAQMEWLQKEMQNNIRYTKLSILAMTEEQLHTTTKRTMEENKQMDTELHYQIRERDRIHHHNQQLIEQNKQMRAYLTDLDQQQLLLAKRTQFFQKYIKKLNEKIRSAEALATKETSKRKQTHCSVETIKRIEKSVEEEARAAKRLIDENTRLNEKLRRAKKGSESALKKQDKATAFILSSFDEIKMLQLESKHRTGKDIMDEIIDGKRGYFIRKLVPANLSTATPEERTDILDLLLMKLSFWDATQKTPLLCDEIAAAAEAAEMKYDAHVRKLPSISRPQSASNKQHGHLCDIIGCTGDHGSRYTSSEVHSWSN